MRIESVRSTSEDQCFGPTKSFTNPQPVSLVGVDVLRFDNAGEFVRAVVCPERTEEGGCKLASGMRCRFPYAVNPDPQPGDEIFDRS